jgi:hypothetical protein
MGFSYRAELHWAKQWKMLVPSYDIGFHPLEATVGHAYFMQSTTVVHAIHSCWLWLRRTDLDRSRAALPVAEDSTTTASFLQRVDPLCAWQWGFSALWVWIRSLVVGKKLVCLCLELVHRDPLVQVEMSHGRPGFSCKLLDTWHHRPTNGAYDNAIPGRPQHASRGGAFKRHPRLATIVLELVGLLLLQLRVFNAVFLSGFHLGGQRAVESKGAKRIQALRLARGAWKTLDI